MDINTLKDNFTWLVLKRIDPVANARRYYAIGWQETLLGWAVVRVYGRMGGSRRTIDPEPFASLDDAWPTIRRLIKTRLRHGYVIAQDLTDVQPVLSVSFRWPPSPVVGMEQVVMFEE
ncbi:MAG: WGR domain-containing protein [Caldilineaceae bacterium]|nr:WGR domain-containing protein [Caldilineaceae bacterium]